MTDYVNNPEIADRHMRYGLSKQAYLRYKNFKKEDFIRFAQAAWLVLAQNRAYISARSQFKYPPMVLQEYQSYLSQNARWIDQGLDMADCRRGWVYQGGETPSLTNLQARLTKMAKQYGFELPQTNVFGVAALDQVEKPTRIFQVFDLSTIERKGLYKENAQAKRITRSVHTSLRQFEREEWYVRARAAND